MNVPIELRDHFCFNVLLLSLIIIYKTRVWKFVCQFSNLIAHVPIFNLPWFQDNKSFSSPLILILNPTSPTSPPLFFSSEIICYLKKTPLIRTKNSLMFGKQYVIEGMVWMRQEGGYELIGRQLVKEKKTELEIYPLN